MRASSRGSVALAGKDIGLGQEPEAAVLAQHLARRVEVAGVAQYFAQAHVVDLRHVNGRVPRGKQGRGTNARRDLGGQRMHVVAEDRACVCVGVEVVTARVASELGFRRTQEIVPALRIRILAGPYLLYDLQAGIMAVGMDAEEAPAFAERP